MELERAQAESQRRQVMATEEARRLANAQSRAKIATPFSAPSRHGPGAQTPRPVRYGL